MSNSLFERRFYSQPNTNIPSYSHSRNLSLISKNPVFCPSDFLDTHRFCSFLSNRCKELRCASTHLRQHYYRMVWAYPVVDIEVHHFPGMPPDNHPDRETDHVYVCFVRFGVRFGALRLRSVENQHECTESPENRGGLLPDLRRERSRGN